MSEKAERGVEGRGGGEEERMKGRERQTGRQRERVCVWRGRGEFSYFL